MAGRAALRPRLAHGHRGAAAHSRANLGAFTLATGQSGRRFRRPHRWLVRQLRRRASLSVDNARLFERPRRIAAHPPAQPAAPAELPEIPGIETAARFSPGGDGHEVGGDFYDVFQTGAARAGRS